MSPNGTAMVIAMIVIRKVPANSGTAPNAPVEPTWSARMAVCGDHSRPNRNSVIGTALEETQGLEQHGENDAYRGEDGDAGAGDQEGLDQRLHPSSQHPVMAGEIQRQDQTERAHDKKNEQGNKYRHV